jgi:hypothetical protein
LTGKQRALRLIANFKSYRVDRATNQRRSDSRIDFGVFPARSRLTACPSGQSSDRSFSPAEPKMSSVNEPVLPTSTFQLSNTYYRFLHRWQWSDEDETLKTGGVSATSGGFSPISGFAVGQAQYVYFCGTDGAIHEYSFGDGGIWKWTDKNLNVLIGGGAPACSTSSNSLLAFPVPQITQRDVFYQPASSPSDLYHFVLNDTNRYLEDVTAIAHGSQGDGTWMSGFANGNDLDVFLAASDGSIHEYRGLAQKKVWRDYNLTNLSQGVPSATYLHNGVAALLPDAAQILVYYAPSAFDVHQIAFQNNVWTDVDMGGPGPNYEAQLIAYSAPNYQWNLFFSCDQGGVFGLCDRFDNGVWGSQQLYSFGAGLEGGMAGFSLGTNTQYFVLHHIRLMRFVEKKQIFKLRYATRFIMTDTSGGAVEAGGRQV